MMSIMRPSAPAKPRVMIGLGAVAETSWGWRRAINMPGLVLIRARSAFTAAYENQLMGNAATALVVVLAIALVVVATEIFVDRHRGRLPPRWLADHFDFTRFLP
eukprot:1836971-Pyramimonas_sp.AAC.1